MSSATGREVFAVLGISHKTASLEWRERFVWSDEERDAFFRAIAQDNAINGGMILSTCNRVEVYGVGWDEEKLHQRLMSQFEKRLTADNLQDMIYWHSGADAIKHLARVTSGLDSMILGEPQITGQVKEAYSYALSENVTSPLLNQVAHRVFRIAKRVRTETDIQNQPVSVPYTAVLLAEQIFGNLSEKSVLLLGAGEMSELAAQHLVEREVENLLIANRNLDRAQALAHRFLDRVPCEVVGMESLASRLRSADIVITSTSAPDPLVHPDDVKEAMRQRKNSPMFFIDLGVPRDVDIKVNEIMNVYLFDIDDLQQVVDDNLQERKRAAEEAEKIIREEVGALNGYLEERDLGPLIRQLMSHLESLQEEELRKTLRRHPDWDSSQQAEIQRAFQSLLKKLVHPTIDWLKETDAEWETQEKRELIRRLFRLGSGDRSP